MIIHLCVCNPASCKTISVFAYGVLTKRKHTISQQICQSKILKFEKDYSNCKPVQIYKDSKNMFVFSSAKS